MASGTTKWVVAAGLVLAGGTALTVYELTQKEEPQDPPAEVQSEPERSLAESPLLQESESTHFVVPPPTQTPAPNLLEPPPRLLPGELAGRLPAEPATQPTSAADAAVLRREGTILTAAKGAIMRTGNRYEFRLEDGSGSFILLENLLLERILYLQQHGGPPPGDNAWVLSGAVTEFHNSNYLLVQKMVIE